MKEVITKAELARELGVTRARVSQFVAAGLPVLPDGKLDRAAALEWVQNHVDRAGASGWLSRKSPQTDSRPSDVQQILLQARAQKLIADAKRAERAEKVAAGELIPASDVKKAAFELYREVRDGVLAIPARCSAAVLAEIRRQLEGTGVPTNVSVAAIDNLLASEIRRVLDELANRVEAQ